MRVLWSASLGIAVAVTSANAQVSSLNRAGSGARAAGMGNAFIGVADDGTAASWNPAGLSQLRKPEFSVVQSARRRRYVLDGYRTRDRSAAFTSLPTTNNSTSIEFASAAIPITLHGQPITLQLGWRRLYQFDDRVLGETRKVPLTASGPAESSIRHDNISDGSVNIWSLAGAVRLTSRLSIGWSTNFYRGEWEERFSVSESPGVGAASDFFTGRMMRGTRGHTASVGLMLAYPEVKVGFVYHAPLDGGFSISQATRSNLAPPVDTSARMGEAFRMHFPRSVGVGVAWLPQPLVRLAADVTYDEWTRFQIEHTDGSTPKYTSGFDDLPRGLSATRNTVTFNAGLERLFPARDRYVPLRLGFSLEPQGARDPVVREDAHQTVLAAGTGINSNSVKFDVALEYRWGSYRNTGNISPVYIAGAATGHNLAAPPEADGTARIQVWRLKVSMIYRLAESAVIKEAVRKVIGS